MRPSVVQSLSCVWLFVTPWTATLQASLSFTISHSLFKLMSVELVMPSNHLVLCHSLLLLPSGSFSVSWFFASGGQSTGSSALASALPVNIQGWSPLGLTGLISLLPKRLSRVFSSTTVQRHQFFGTWPFYCLALTSVHDYWKDHSFDYMDLCSNFSAF